MYTKYEHWVNEKSAWSHRRYFDMKMLKGEDWLDAMGVKNYTVNADGTVDVKGNVQLASLGFSEFPVKFNKVSGDFHCSFNKLTTLEGSPKEVGGDFMCNSNKLKSLNGGPKRVGGRFWCQDNKLTSLEGSPKEVGGDFWCKNNKAKFTEEAVKAVTNVKGTINV